MGLILTTSLLIFILILDALRNQISIHLKHDCITKQDKKRIVSKATEYYNPWNITGQTIWKKEKEPPEYETIAENTKEDTTLTTEERNQQTEQEMEDLQGTVKSLQKEITTHYPLMQN